MVYGQSWNECVTHSRCHDTAKGLDAGRVVLTNCAATVRRTDLERLVTKTVAIFQEHHVCSIQIGGARMCLFCQRVLSGNGENEWFLEQFEDPQTRFFKRARRQDNI